MTNDFEFRIRRRTLLGAAGLAGLSLMAGPSLSPALAQAGKATLTIGLSADVGQLVFGPVRGAASYVVNQLVHRGLVKFGKDGKVIPALAQSFEALDQTTFKFVLRDGLVFHDGSKLDSSVVKANLEYLKDPSVGSAIYSLLATVTSIETPDAKTIVIKISGPNSSFFEYMADPTVGIAPPSALKKGEPNWIGAGPFKLVTNEKGVGLTLAAADTYYNRAGVKLTGVKVLYYPDSAARANALIAGDVDLIDFVAWEDFDRVQGESKLVLDAVPGPFVYGIFNTETKPFSDPRVRRAVGYAINRANIVAAAFYGHGKPLFGVPVTGGNPRFSADMANMFEYNPAKAKALLAEAGLASGLKISLLTSSTYVFFRDMALSIQADLKAIGIEVVLDAPDWATYSTAKRSGKYDMAVAGGAPSVTGPVYLKDYAIGGPASFGSYKYDATAILAAISAGEAIADPAAARAEYKKATDLIRDDVPFLPLAQRSQAFGYKKTVTGFANLPGFLSITGSGITIEDVEIR